MKLLTFPNEHEQYEQTNSGWKYIGEFVVAPFEFLWIIIDNSSIDGLEKKEAKTLKKLKIKLKAISQYKDTDKDARILLPNEQKVLLQDNELDIIIKYLTANKIKSTRLSDTLSDLWDIIDSTIDQDDPKPQLG